MSWLGKILTFLVLIASVVWAALTVNAYVTRTNWKVRADAYQAALKLSEDNRIAEQSQWRAEKAQLVSILEKEKSTTTDLNKSLADLSAASKAGDEGFKSLQAVVTTAATTAAIKDASEKTTLEELNKTRERNIALEDRSVRQELDKKKAERNELTAVNERNQARALAAESADKVATLQTQVTELKQTGGSGTAAVLRSIGKTAAPLAENTRGEVTESNGAFVRINIGIDAGLEPGSRLDIFREDEGKYLGTLVIQGTALRPKEAVGAFRPASGRPVAQLRADDLPRKGDNVGIVPGPGR